MPYYFEGGKNRLVFFGADDTSDTGICQTILVKAPKVLTGLNQTEELIAQPLLPNFSQDMGKSRNIKLVIGKG